MMLQNLFTGLNLLADLSVGCTSDHLQGFRPVRSLPLSKRNLDRCAVGEGRVRVSGFEANPEILGISLGFVLSCFPGQPTPALGIEQ